MCDGHFASIFANSMDFPWELLIFKDYIRGWGKIPGVKSKFKESVETLQIP